jgi:hypothetical protein
MSNATQKKIGPLVSRYWQADTHAAGADFYRLSQATSGIAFGQLGSRMAYAYPVPGSVYNGNNICCPWLELDASISGLGSPGDPGDTVNWGTYQVPWYHQIGHNAIGVHVQFAVTTSVPVIMRARTQTLIASVTTTDSEDSAEIQTKQVSVGVGDWPVLRGVYWGDALMYVYEPDVDTDRCCVVVPLAKLARTDAYAQTNDPPIMYIYSMRVFDCFINQTDVTT